MGDVNNPALNIFTTRMRQLILQYRETIGEKGQLQQRYEELTKEVERLRGEIERIQREYDNLMLARMLEITDGDVETAKARIAKLIRDVNKCITYLKEK
ncbi:MAG: hypothetical protein LUC22_02060 [Prevotella sp.]|nr:hypothetical protein [Prevotella sp.]